MIRVDVSSFVSRAAALSRGLATGEAVEGALLAAGKQLFEDCYTVSPTVPLNTGALRGSGSLHVNGKLVATGADMGYLRTFTARGADRGSRGSVVVRFDAPYAAIVHESVNMRFRYPGSGAKFLSSKLRNGKKYLDILRQHLLGGR